MRVNNLRGKRGFIATAAAQGSNSPACVGSQKNRRGDREPTPNRARWNSSHSELGTETRKDLFAKRGRRSLIELRKAHRRAQSFHILKRVHAVRALFQMTFEFSGAHGIQFVIEIAVHNSAGAVTDHG